jgi:hypothetical protein
MNVAEFGNCPNRSAIQLAVDLRCLPQSRMPSHPVARTFLYLSLCPMAPSRGLEFNLPTRVFENSNMTNIQEVHYSCEGTSNARNASSPANGVKSSSCGVARVVSHRARIPSRSSGVLENVATVCVRCLGKERRSA